MKYDAKLVISSDPRLLRLVRNFTEGMAEASGMDKKEAMAIKHAVDEACANVIQHAYGGARDKRIDIKYKKSRRTFEVIIEDEGPKCRQEDLRCGNLEDLSKGGLGILLIGRAFDEYFFDEKKKKGNRLRLIRHLEAGDAD